MKASKAKANRGTRDDGGLGQARAQLRGIRDMVAALVKAEDDDSEESAGKQDGARAAIDEDPLSVQVRDGWRQPGAESEGPEEYEILLCTGGPACRIVGELDDHAYPDTARIEYQDWGTPWTTLPLTDEERADVLRYAGCFYFGD